MARDDRIVSEIDPWGNMRDAPAEPDVPVFTFRQPWSTVGWNIVWGSVFTLPWFLFPEGFIPEPVILETR